MIFHDSTAGESDREDIAGDITILTTSPVNVLASAISAITALTGIDSVDVIAYYEDEQGEPFLCSSQINPFAVS